MDMEADFDTLPTWAPQIEPYWPTSSVGEALSRVVGPQPDATSSAVLYNAFAPAADELDPASPTYRAEAVRELLDLQAWVAPDQVDTTFAAHRDALVSTPADLAYAIDAQIGQKVAAGTLPASFTYYVDVMPESHIDEAVTAPLRISTAANQPVGSDEADAVEEQLKQLADTLAIPGSSSWQVEVDPTDPTLGAERGTDLSFANFAQRDLAGIDLSTTDVSSANLRGVDLTDANLHRAQLGHTQLRDATLVRASAARADLSHAELDHANLAAADLQGADLTGVSATESTMVATDLRHTTIVHANLDGADLTCADLRHADVRHTSLAGANLRGAVLADQRYHHVDFTGADLRNADLTRTTFSDCTFAGTKIADARTEPVAHFQMVRGGAVLPEVTAAPSPVPPAPVAPPVPQPAMAGPKP